jgi:hypothetical protein
MKSIKLIWQIGEANKSEREQQQADKSLISLNV